VKFLKLIKLGLKNVTSHKKRTFVTIITISTLFGVLLCFSSIINGLQNAIIKWSNTAFGEDIYIITYPCGQGVISCDEEKASNTDAKSVAKKYGGDFAGTTGIYDGLGLAIDKNIALPVIREQLDPNTPNILITLSDANAMNLPEEEKSFMKLNNPSEQKSNELLSSSVGKIYTDIRGRTAKIVGLTAYSGNLKIAENDWETDPLDIYLGQVWTEANSYYIDGDQLIDAKKSADYVYYVALFKFSSPNDAYQFLSEVNGRELFGDRVAAISGKMELLRVIGFFRIILIVTAIIIMVFSFIKIIDEDSKNIALYKTLGATNFDIIVTYTAYLIGTTILSILFSIIIEIALSLITSGIYSSRLIDLLNGHYIQQIHDFIPLIGFDRTVLITIFSMLIPTPVCLILTIDQLSSKNITKRLKK